MKPSNTANMFHVLDKSLWYAPQQETVMGLAQMSTPNQSKPVHTFNTASEAKQAYADKKIAVNDHIVVKNLSA